MVEDVSAYVSFIKEKVGITHEDELVKAIEILANKVHPLALGNVERFLSQSRLIAKKILRTHMKKTDEHLLDEIVENMASKLYFHGHPINRIEARDDLKLKVVADLPAELETAMWDLYKEYETEFKNADVFQPQGDLAALKEKEPPLVAEYHLTHVIVESSRLSSVHKTKRRYTLIAPQPGQKTIDEDILEQGWIHSLAQVD